MVNGKVTLVGVVSFGGQNCPNNLPVGFSRVSFQRDWILSNTDAGDWQCAASGNQFVGKHLKKLL
jgi:secreted trypsin-like serine protease